MLKGSYGKALRRLRRSERSKAIPEVITLILNFLAHALHFKMPTENTKLNTSLFMEDVQKWKAIGKKFGLDAAKAEKKITMSKSGIDDT